MDHLGGIADLSYMEEREIEEFGSLNTLMNNVRTALTFGHEDVA